MEKKICKNCAHYCQHYGLNQRKFYLVYCGHCTFSKVRNKRPDATACGDFIPGEPDEAAFAGKEYLSKEMLQYFLNLELLPEIGELCE